MHPRDMISWGFFYKKYYRFCSGLAYTEGIVSCKLMTKTLITFIALLLLLIGAGLFFLSMRPESPIQDASQTHIESGEQLQTTSAAPATETRAYQIIRAQDIPKASTDFTFTATVPGNWQAEAVPGSQAISFFDAGAQGESSLDQSQIFMRSFRANDFLTLSTVVLHEREPLTINGRPAVRYDIEKKAEAAPFPDQPAWRSQRHIVTDIRVSDSNPSVFYVIAKRPDGDLAVYEKFLQDLKVTETQVSATFTAPIDGFRERITKKPFGILITPETSPVQPERFRGYHTGADVEYGDVKGEVLVRAVADGEVVVANVTQGYGGLLAIQHSLDGNPVIGIYGHVKPSRLPRVGQTVKAGEQVAILGEGEGPETDGERKHLHFGLLKGTQLNVRGYVQNQEELKNWYNPLDVISK